MQFSQFTIEGTWKNVGKDTFGQAEKNAIITFDGKNCNFFSPKDTYTFTNNGDTYKLECLGLISAEPLFFSVGVRDENNIDIFFEDKIIKLTRVE